LLTVKSGATLTSVNVEVNERLQKRCRMCEVAPSGGLTLARRIPLVIFLMIACCGYPFAFAQSPNAPVVVRKPKAQKKIKLKPLKPLSEKDIQRANKKALQASSAKSIQKANEKTFKDQAKAIKKANEKAAQANKALQKAHAKALRKAAEQARADTKK
jgi:hypothetical protein